MATEYKLPYTASEIYEKLESIDNIDVKLNEKADLVGGKIPTSQLPDDIGGGASSWNNLLDKPFGEIDNSINWDGTPTDEFIEEDEGVGFYKVSDTYCDADILIGKTFAVFNRDANNVYGTFTISSEHIFTDFGENCFGVMVDDTPFILVTFEATTVGEIEFPSAGTWFLSTPEMFVNLLEIVSIDKIDKKYIPSDIGTWAGMPDKPFGESGLKIEWDGVSTDEEPVDVSDTMGAIIYKVGEAQTKDSVIGATCKFDMTEDGDSWQSMEYTIADSDIIDIDEQNCFVVFYNGQLGIFFSVLSAGAYNFMGLDFTFPSAGIWFVKASNYTPTYLGKSEIKKIDKKFLPDDIGGGVSSWNDLEDKPFGETGWSIEWDMNPTDSYVPIDDGAGFYKVSDIVPTKEELVGTNLKAEADGEHWDLILSDADIEDYGTDCYGFAGMPFFLVTTKATDTEIMGMSFSFPSAGVWFVSSSGVTWTYYLGKGETKQIDPKFIPNYFGETGTYIAYDLSEASTVVTVPANEETGTPELRYSKIANPIDGSIEGYLMGMGMDGESIDMVIGSADVSVYTSDTGSTYSLYVLNIKADNEVCNMEEDGIPEFVVYEAGLYWFDESCLGESGIFKYLKSPDYNIVKIDKKYIPDDIAASVALTFDEFPTEGSQNPVKSMGIHSAISALEGKITSTFCYKGTVENYSDLPTEGNTVGDVWNIANADESHGVEPGDNAAWDGNDWDILAGVIDLSEYYTKTEVDSIALNGIANLANYYTKSEIDKALDNVSVDIDLSGYFTKTEISDSYYTKSETYTKSQIDSALDNVSVDLSGYYTKSEVDSALKNVSVDLSDYYTKLEINNIVDYIESIREDIDIVLGEIGDMIGG